MPYLTAIQLNHLLGAVSIQAMQIVLCHAVVKLYGVSSDVPVLPPSAADETLTLLRNASARAHNASVIAELLTDRELEVSLLLHWQNDRIARALNVTVHTVRAHVRAAKDKTGAVTRTELALLVRGYAAG